eukprot:8968475-Pyramimonas_sp.AAC.1
MKAHSSIPLVDVRARWNTHPALSGPVRLVEIKLACDPQWANAAIRNMCPLRPPCGLVTQSRELFPHFCVNGLCCELGTTVFSSSSLNSTT